MNIACKCNKHCHESQGAAEAQLRALLKVKPDYVGKVYPCPCTHWHIGRLKKRAHKNKL